MASTVSSVNLSVLSFALSLWLDGSSQLRRSLILFPLDVGSVEPDDEPSSSRQDSNPPQNEGTNRLTDRIIQWFTKPTRDLDEVEKSILGALDLSSSVLLLRLLGTVPILPFILNPLSITIALPQRMIAGSVKWRKVILLCLLLSALHEAQRTSVAAGISWIRMKKAAKNDATVGHVVLRGEKIEQADENEDEEPCVICSAGQSDATLSESITSLASLAPQAQSQSQPNHISSAPGPLEAFCVHAPTKHPMHRSCFLAWKDAYWEGRSSRPIITLMSSDAVAPFPGTWQWRRAQAILGALGPRIWNMTYYVPLAPNELNATQGINGIGESVFTLECPGSRTTGSSLGSNEVLGRMVSAWPPCPGCRSAVKLTFARVKPVRRRGSSRNGKSLLGQLLQLWVRSWKQLVTGRTILVKTATQVLFAAFIASILRMRKSHARHALFSRGSAL